MFSHFTNMYAASDKRLDTKFKIDEFDNFSIQELVAAGCIKPDESKYSEILSINLTCFLFSIILFYFHFFC